MAGRLEMEIKVGVFVASGIALTALAVLMLGGSSSLFSRQLKYSAHFPATDGLFQGAKVVLGGLTVGAVKEIDLDPSNKEIKVSFSINKKYETFVRMGSEVEILTQGVLGDKYISVGIGPNDAALLPDGSELPVKLSKNLAEMLSRGDQLMTSLGSIAGSLNRLLESLENENTKSGLFKNLGTTAKNLSEISTHLNAELADLNVRRASKNLNGILEKINNGTGTLGALVNDPGLYDDTKALLGGANRNRIIRNLVRKTIEDAPAQKETH